MALTKVTGEVIQSSTSINANITGNLTGDVTGSVNSTGISTFSGGVQLGTGTTISSPASNEFAISTNGSERVRVDSSGDLQLANGNLVFSTSGTGIDFSATANSSGTMTSELLDDYEEGTFTPSVRGSSTAGGVNYISRNAKYLKIGNKVWWEIYINWNSGTGTGNLEIPDFPFTVQSSTPTYPAVNIGYFHSITKSADHQVIALQSVGTTHVYFYQIPNTGGTNVQLPYDAAGALIMSGHYTTDS